MARAVTESIRVLWKSIPKIGSKPQTPQAQPNTMSQSKKTVEEEPNENETVRTGRFIHTRRSQLYSNSNEQRTSRTNLTIADTPTESFSSLQDYKSFLKSSVKEFYTRYNQVRFNHSLTVDDFELIKTLEFSSGGKIIMSVCKKDDQVYTLKCTSKEYVVENEAVEHIKNELRISMSIKFHFLLSSMDCFEDNSYIYSLKPFMPGGSLSYHIKYLGYFEEKLAIFCAAQIILALEYLHGFKVVHRDIRPPSVIMDHRGYVRLANFSLSKIVSDRTFTLCGTPAYVAPEILVKKGHGLSVDWWSFGVLVYEMSSGNPPFSSTSFEKTFEHILRGRFRMKEWFSTELRSLFRALLSTDTTKRLGCSKNGASDVKNHRWFADVNWFALLNKKSPSPYLPSLMSHVDTTLYGQLPEEPLFIDETDRFAEYFDDI